MCVVLDVSCSDGAGFRGCSGGLTLQHVVGIGLEWHFFPLKA